MFWLKRVDFSDSVNCDCYPVSLPRVGLMSVVWVEGDAGHGEVVYFTI